MLQNRGNTILMGVSLACEEGLVVWLDLNVGIISTSMGSMLPEVSRCHRTVSRGAFALLLCHPHPALRLRRLLSRPYGVAQPLFQLRNQCQELSEMDSERLCAHHHLGAPECI